MKIKIFSEEQNGTPVPSFIQSYLNLVKYEAQNECYVLFSVSTLDSQNLRSDSLQILVSNFEWKHMKNSTWYLKLIQRIMYKWYLICL